VKSRVAEVEVFSLGAVESAGPALQEYKAPTAADLHVVQQFAADVLGLLRGGGGLRWSPPVSVKFGIWASRTKTPGELTISTMMQTDTAPDFFRAAVTELLQRLRGQLRLCLRAECSRPFVFNRSHQRFCSPKCQSKAGFARYVESQGGKKDFAEKRSEAYYARKEKMLGKLRRQRRLTQ
jgi:hypothetical protein